MSADNWADCPRCLARASARREADLKAAADSYGKVDEATYRENTDSIKDVRTADYTTFREDYAIYGAADGTVRVDYSGRCMTCGLDLSFNDTHDIPGVES